MLMCEETGRPDEAGEWKREAGLLRNPTALVSLLVATGVVKYSSDVGLRTGVTVGAVAIVVAAIVISKRRAHGMADGAPSSTEVTGAISPVVEGASAAPDVTGVAAKDDAEDHATAVKRPD